MSINMRFFEYWHLPDELQPASSVVHSAAWDLMTIVPDGPEKEAGYRKLLEAKDCFVRASLQNAPVERHDPPPVKCKRNTYEDCNCGQCQNRKNYAAHLH